MKRYQKRLEELDIEHLCESITAMQKTLDEYRGVKSQRYCALCEMVDDNGMGGPICEQCPWKVMKGTRCGEYMNRWYISSRGNDIYSLRKGVDPIWTSMRKRQLSK